MCEKLNAWNAYTVDAAIEESLDDTRLIMKYNDHGDDFIVVCTKDGKKYEYGWYCNRPWYPDYDKLSNDGERYFIRNPKLNGEEDYHHQFSNSFWWLTDSWHARGYGWKLHAFKIHDRHTIEFNIKSIARKLEEGQNRGLIYDETYFKKNEIDRYLKENSIDSDDEIYKFVESLPWTSKNKDGVDGIAGKIDISDESVIIGDTITKVILNGKEINWRALKGVKHLKSDEWGVSQFCVRLY